MLLGRVLFTRCLYLYLQGQTSSSSCSTWLLFLFPPPSQPTRSSKQALAIVDHVVAALASLVIYDRKSIASSLQVSPLFTYMLVQLLTTDISETRFQLANKELTSFLNSRFVFDIRHTNLATNKAFAQFDTQDHERHLELTTASISHFPHLACLIAFDFRKPSVL